MADTEEHADASESPQLDPKPQAGDIPKLRSKAFRTKLLARLPTLAASTWDAGDALNVYHDFKGGVDLDADAFLGPLEPLAEDRRD